MNKQHQQFKLLGSKFNVSFQFRRGNLSLLFIDQIAVNFQQHVFTVSAPHDVVDAQNDFLHVERLGDVVIRSLFQTDDAVKFLVTGTDKDDRYFTALFLDYFKKIESALFIEHDIQHPEMNVLIIDVLESLFIRIVGLNFIAFLFQVALHKLVEVLLIVNYC